MTGLAQQRGMSPEIRAIVASDAVLAHPADGPTHVRLAIDAALTDYRRAVVRVLVEAGVSSVLAWRVMGELPLDRAIPAHLTAPLSPEGSP